MHLSAAFLLVVLFTAGCAERKENGDTPPASASARAAVASGGVITGTLREQLPVPPYVYVRLETEGGDVWAAVNEAPLAIGSTVTVYNVLPMEQFVSKTLVRTFERIYFGSLDASGGAMPGASGALRGASGAPGESSGAPPAEDAKIGSIARAPGANARTIGELWAEKDRLAGRTVSFRGVVVKYNPGVMGKNWMHLQDGSGRAINGTHDITVTSLESVAVGDTVIVTGTAQTNRDLGAGYTYALIVEEATMNRSARAVPIRRSR